jgi:hypothetical protein
MRRGLGIIGIILAILILIFVLSFIAGSVKSAVSKAPQTIENLGISLGVAPAPYYNLTILGGSRGEVKFIVLDPDPVNGGYITDFNKVTGYKVSEDNIPTTVQSVDEYRQLYIATVFDSNMPAGTPSCDSYLEALNSIKFKDTNIAFFPGSEFFYNKTEANCKYTGGAYWTAIQNATYALPVGEYYHALVIISDGDNANDPTNAEEIENIIGDAVRGLSRQDLQHVEILTSNVANCENNPIINATRVALGIDIVLRDPANSSIITGYKSADSNKWCKPISQFSYQNLADTFAFDVPTITLHYKPYAEEDGLIHAIAVKASKGSYYGRRVGNITY